MTDPANEIEDPAKLTNLFEDEDLSSLLAEVEQYVATAGLEEGLGVPQGAEATEALQPAIAKPASTTSTNGVVAGGAVQQELLQRVWVDDDPEDFKPATRPGRRFGTSVLTTMIALVLLGGLAWLVVPAASDRIVHRDHLRFNNAVLTAQPIELSWIRPAMVEELYFDYRTLPDEILPRGTPVARLIQTSVDGQQEESVELTVPVDARFASLDAPIGSVIAAGDPVITVYDPNLMVVHVTTKVDALDNLRRGMRAELTNDSIGISIEGSVDSVVPLLGTDHEPTENRLVNVRVRPDPGSATNLVPGIRFHVRIDTGSAPDGASKIVFTDAVRDDDRSASTPNGEGSDSVPGSGGQAESENQRDQSAGEVDPETGVVSVGAQQDEPETPSPSDG